jgi:hypothetical protein
MSFGFGKGLSTLVLWAVAGPLMPEVPESNPDGILMFAPSPVAPRDIDAWQTGPYCGANALFVMLRLNGISVSAEALRKEVPVADKGASMLDLKRTALRYGLPVDVFELDPPQLRNQPLPLIVHASLTDDPMGHYATVVSFDEETVRLIDGTSEGLITVENAPFNRAFSGYALVQTGTPGSSRLKGLLKWICCIEAAALAGATVVLWVSYARRHSRGPASRSD